MFPVRITYNLNKKRIIFITAEAEKAVGGFLYTSFY